jgi:hypothetical protein
VQLDIAGRKFEPQPALFCAKLAKFEIFSDAGINIGD